MLLAMTFGLVNDCYVVQEYPGIEPVESFNSTAMMRFSADAVNNTINDTSVFDLPAAADQIMTVREGDTIGTGTTQVVKVMDTGLMVVEKSARLCGSAVYIPEDAFVEQEEQPTALPSLPLVTKAAPLQKAHQSFRKIHKPQQKFCSNSNRKIVSPWQHIMMKSATRSFAFCKQQTASIHHISRDQKEDPNAKPGAILEKLVRNKDVEEDIVQTVLSRAYAIRRLTIDGNGIDGRAVTLIPKEIIDKNMAMPFAVEGRSEDRDCRSDNSKHGGTVQIPV